MSNNLKMPKHSFVGDRALEYAEETIVKLGKKALIVTGKSMIKQGHVERLETMLEKHGVECAVFSDIPGEPTDKMIEEGFSVYKNEGCDFIIGIGGGSPLDSAKAIGVLASSGGRISDYNGKPITKAIPPLVAIPSTAGTGSEATPFTIVTDTENDIKMLLKGDPLMPTVAVVESMFSMKTPRDVTVSTGLDALTHAIESYTSRKATPETDEYAVSAIKRIFSYLPIAVETGGNKKGRDEMALAAYEAGVSFGNSSVTVVHGMSRPIGALFHVPHGLSNAMLLTKCLSYVADGAYDRFADLADAIGVSVDGDDAKSKTRAFISAVDGLCAFCQVPTLEERGIDKEVFFANIDKMAQDALDSGSPANTRKSLNKDDIVRIYESLW